VPQKVDYNAAKAAVVMLTKSLALELGRHNIRVNAVGPGATDTQGGGNAGQTSEEARRFADVWISRLSLPVKYAEPDDIARVVLFLASPASGYVTGQVIYADAGYLNG
jgi:NAD(P)-dependent dehydrogenase (short-subunit alcohol dehydrogenase family)